MRPESDECITLRPSMKDAPSAQTFCERHVPALRRHTCRRSGRTEDDVLGAATASGDTDPSSGYMAAAEVRQFRMV